MINYNIIRIASNLSYTLAEYGSENIFDNPNEIYLEIEDDKEVNGFKIQSLNIYLRSFVKISIYINKDTNNIISTDIHPVVTSPDDGPSEMTEEAWNAHIKSVNDYILPIIDNEKDYWYNYHNDYTDARVIFNMTYEDWILKFNQTFLKIVEKYFDFIDNENKENKI